MSPRGGPGLGGRRWHRLSVPQILVIASAALFLICGIVCALIGYALTP
jgi:hypothetical protein